jgi:hypothetical protein
MSAEKERVHRLEATRAQWQAEPLRKKQSDDLGLPVRPALRAQEMAQISDRPGEALMNAGWADGAVFLTGPQAQSLLGAIQMKRCFSGGKMGARLVAKTFGCVGEGGHRCIPVNGSALMA